MKKSRFSEEQIAFASRQVGGGASVREVCRKMRVTGILNGVRLGFSRPGKPTDNGLIKVFNGWLRAECLNENWFLSLIDAKEKVESLRRHYNADRPLSALGSLAPEEFDASSGQARMAG
jgi:putative transposase